MSAVSYERIERFPNGDACSVCRENTVADAAGPRPLLAHRLGMSWWNRIRRIVSSSRAEGGLLFHPIHEACLKTLIAMGAPNHDKCPICLSPIDMSSVYSLKERCAQILQRVQRAISWLPTAMLTLKAADGIRCAFLAVSAVAAFFAPGGLAVRMAVAVGVDGFLQARLMGRIRLNTFCWIDAAFAALHFPSGIGSMLGRWAVDLAQPSLALPERLLLPIRAAAAMAGGTAVIYRGWISAAGMIAVFFACSFQVALSLERRDALRRVRAQTVS